MADEHLHAVVHDGDGPYAVLLHGLLGSRSYWLDNIEALQTVCRPVVVEMWGHGRSPGPVLHYVPVNALLRRTDGRDCNIRRSESTV